MPPLYRYYYLASVLIFIGFGIQLFAAIADLPSVIIPNWLTTSWFFLFAYYFPLSIGVTIGLWVTWRYWRWLITERNE